MRCINHPEVEAHLVPWWPYTHFLDVECGICPDCAAGNCKNLHLVELGSADFWSAFDDMRANSWTRDGDE